MTSLPPLHLKLTVKNLLVFMFLFFAMHELHELAHIITGKLICGSWGHRDFNVWDVCQGCLAAHPVAITATFAGPLFTFLMLWIGRYLIIHGQAAGQRSLGLVMILSNMQFGRMYMAAMGGGDEVWGLRQLFLNPAHSNTLMVRLAGFVIVSAICLPPLITAYRAIANKRKVLLFTALIILPLVLDTVVILILLNGILQKGVLSQVWMMGTPLLITTWFALCLLITAMGYKSLARFAMPVQ